MWKNIQGVIQHLFNRVGARERKLNNYQMNIGHPYAGASLHFHGPTMSTLLFGAKHFFMYPPKETFYNTEQIYQWYQSSYPRLKEEGSAPMECIQQPGDVVFIPEGWTRWFAGIQAAKEAVDFAERELRSPFGSSS